MIAKFSKALLGAALLATASVPALAADMYEPPVVEAPPPAPIDTYQEPEAVDFGGWYIRGDIDYHATKWRGANYVTYGPPPGTNAFATGSIDSSWSLGGGIGYKANKYFRTDLTVDWMGSAKFRGTTTGTCGLPPVPCASTDTAKFGALLLLANAYAEFGTYHGFTPYIGAGIGGAHVKWGDLRNSIGGIITTHRGASEWRFAAALMAGTSYCLTNNLSLDVGYRFTHIAKGRMFEYAGGAGPGFDKGMNIHEGRAGLRYQFGGSTGCSEPEVAYVPEPVEPPVYK